MAFEYVDRCYVEIDGEELPDAIKLDVQPQRDSKPIKTMNRRDRPRGHSKGQPHWELSLEVAVPVAGEYAWREKYREGLEHTVVVDEAGVHRVRYNGVLITDVSSTYQAEGETRRTIKLSVLDEVEE